MTPQDLRGLDPHAPSVSRPWGWLVFWLAVLGLALWAAAVFLSGDMMVQDDQTARPWYGRWWAAAFAAGFFALLVFGFLRSPPRREWRHLGLAEAYLVALFAEMYGLPLTIYLLGLALGVNLGFGLLEGHLWAVLLDRLGILPLARGVALVMAVSSALIVLGLGLMAGGWWQTWRAKGDLVEDGLYRLVRHPQYLGFLLVIIGFLVQWPTLPTVVLFPFLVLAYIRLARREEADLAARFGDRWEAYRARAPFLIPRSTWAWTGPGERSTTPHEVRAEGRRIG